MIRFLALCFIFFTTQAHAYIIVPETAKQGSLIIGHTQAGSKVTQDGEKRMLSRNGTFLISLSRDRKKDVVIKSTILTGETLTKIIKVQKREYPTQRINKLPGKYVSPPASVTKRIKSDNRAIGKARRSRLDRPLYESGFIMPVSGGRISGEWGNQRILNGIPKRAHNGTDIAAPTGTPIVTPADGKVTLIKDMYYTGHTVMVDHGHGLVSVYCHLSKVNVEHGQGLKQGEKIGEVGATGRATGPHLHWGMTLGRTHVDPMTAVANFPSE